MSETKEKSFDIDKFYEEKAGYMKTLGFYEDYHKGEIHRMILRHCNKEFVKTHLIEDSFFNNNGKLVVKFKPRVESMQLSDERYAEEFKVELKKIITREDYTFEAFNKQNLKFQEETKEIAEEFGLSYSEAVELWVKMSNHYKKNRERK